MEWPFSPLMNSLRGGGGGGGDNCCPLPPNQHRQTEPIHMEVGGEVLPV